MFLSAGSEDNRENLEPNRTRPGVSFSADIGTSPLTPPTVVESEETKKAKADAVEAKAAAEKAAKEAEMLRARLKSYENEVQVIQQVGENEDYNDGMSVVTRLPKNKIQVPRDIKVPQFPNAVGLKEWKSKFITEIVAACPFTERDVIIKWFLECDEKPFEELQDPGNDDMLPVDTKIATGFNKITIPKKLKDDMDRKGVVLMDENKLLAGRQKIKMTYQYFKTSSHMSTMYSFHHLQNLRWFGDNRIREFLNTWEKIWDNLENKEAITEITKRDVFADKFKETTVLATEYQHYVRQRRKHDLNPSSAEDGTFEFMWTSCECHLAEKEEEKRVKEVKNTFDSMAKGNGRGHNALPSEKGTRDGKGGRGRGKGDARARSKSERRREPVGLDNGIRNVPPPPVAAPAEERCYFHSAKFYGKGEGCTNPNCKRSHDLIPKSVFENMNSPSRRSSTPGRKSGPEAAPSEIKGRKGEKGDKGGKGGGKRSKGKSKSRSRSRSSSQGKKITFCAEYRKTGTCTYAQKHGGCQWPHMTDEMVKKAEERLKQKADPKAKAKAKPDAKAKAKARANSRGRSSAAAAPLADDQEEEW